MKRLFAVLFLTACSHASTQMTDLYRDASVKRLDFQRVAAIAITRDPDIRKTAEDEMVRQLGAKGVASYTILSAEDERNAETVRAKLQSAGIDGAVTMSVLSVGDEPMDVKGQIPDPYKAFAGYQGGGARGSTGWETVARIETQIFSVSDGKLIWSAATKTFNPKDATKIVASVSKAVADELRNSNLIK